MGYSLIKKAMGYLSTSYPIKKMSDSLVLKCDFY